VQSGRELTRFDLSGAAPAAGSTALLPADVTAAALDRGAELVAFGSRGGQVAIRRAQDAAGAALDYFGHRGAVTSIAVDAPHALAITGGADGDVRLWDAASGAPRTDEIEHGAPVVAVAIAPDGARVASAGGTTVRLWQTADAAPLATLPLAAAASALAFAPDGTLAIGDAAGTVVVRSGAESEPPVATLRGAARIASLAVSADGLLVAGDDAGTVRLWRIADGAALGAPAEIGGAVRWVGFADDGKTALAVGDRWLHSYAVDAAGLVSLHARPLARPPLPGPPVAAGSGERLAVLTFGPGGLDVAAVDLGRHDAAPLAAALAGRDWPAALGLDLDAAGTPVRR
jgi:hypothetical protein